MSETKKFADYPDDHYRDLYVSKGPKGEMVINLNDYHVRQLLKREVVHIGDIRIRREDLPLAEQSYLPRDDLIQSMAAAIRAGIRWAAYGEIGLKAGTVERGGRGEVDVIKEILRTDFEIDWKQDYLP